MENCAMEHRPTLRQRVGRALGFRYHLGAEPEGIDTLTGWSMTRSRLHFSLTDRMRLLISGKLLVVTVQHFDAPSPDENEARLADRGLRQWRIG